MRIAERVNARFCSEVELSGSGKHQPSFFGGRDVEIFSIIRLKSEALEGIVFSDLYCDFANFEHKRFKGCWFQNFELFGASIDECQFSECFFNGLLLYGCKVDYSKFQKCTFVGSVALGSNFLGVDFTLCNLRGIRFSSDNMKHFSTLDAVYFDRGTVSDSTFGDVLCEGNTEIPKERGS